jgi:nucleoside-diphosphate-sugar epimerase
MATVLVTGAAGFIGRAVVDSVTAGGDQPIPVSHRWRDAVELRRLAGGGPLDRCIHLGWYADPRDYLVAAEPNLASLAASLDLVRLLIDRGCRHLVVAGTSAEYGAPTGPVDETAPALPATVYAAAKTALRMLLESSLRPPSMAMAWARVFNVTGPGEDPRRIVPQVVTALLQGRPIALSDGRQVRDYLCVEDVATALASLSRAGVEGIVNVSSGAGVPLRDVFLAIADRSGAPPELLRFGERGRGMHDPDILVGVNRRLRESCGWSPALSFEGMLDRTIAYWREQPVEHPAVPAPAGR